MKNHQGKGLHVLYFITCYNCMKKGLRSFERQGKRINIINIRERMSKLEYIMQPILRYNRKNKSS